MFDGQFFTRHRPILLAFRDQIEYKEKRFFEYRSSAMEQWVFAILILGAAALFVKGLLGGPDFKSMRKHSAEYLDNYYKNKKPRKS